MAETIKEGIYCNYMMKKFERNLSVANKVYKRNLPVLVLRVLKS